MKKHDKTDIKISKFPNSAFSMRRKIVSYMQLQACCWNIDDSRDAAGVVKSNNSELLQA